jgi:hypothetical protein
MALRLAEVKGAISSECYNLEFGQNLAAGQILSKLQIE